MLNHLTGRIKPVCGPHPAYGPFVWHPCFRKTKIENKRFVTPAIWWWPTSLCGGGATHLTPIRQSLTCSVLISSSAAWAPVLQSLSATLSLRIRTSNKLCSFKLPPTWMLPVHWTFVRFASWYLKTGFKWAAHLYFATVVSLPSMPQRYYLGFAKKYCFFFFI